MELYKEILVKLLEKEKINISFSGLKLDSDDMVEMQSYKALKKIKNVIENDSLSDFECVEEVVCILENIGSSGGNRHDF